ncbi:hypothetical protein ACFY9A_38595 [Streptomyces rubradiris]|uniref:hypothetical protein n=1 Tax=Streptomyces rubradiris TaxID=285531 RepID=UPI0036E57DB8
MRRLLHRVDGDALDTAVGSWLADREEDRTNPGQAPAYHPRRTLAVDGKTVRGARRPDGTQVHLLAAMTGIGQIIAQREISSKTNEITVFKPLLAPLGLADTVVTFDALHSPTEHARFLVQGERAHYIAVIKGDHPTLQREPKRPPCRDVPLQDKTRGTAHGRVEIRRFKTCTVACGLDSPPCRPGRADRAPPPDRHHRQGHRGTRLRRHQPDGPPGRTRPARLLDARPLGYREQDAPRARHQLRRGRLPRPHWHRTPGHGHPAQPRHRRPPAYRPQQHHRRTPPTRPQRHPRARHPGHQAIKQDGSSGRRGPVATTSATPSHVGRGNSSV